MLDKIKSRKFIVFAIWTVISAVLLILKLELGQILQYYFFISLIYIGGQTTIDSIERLKK